MNFFDNKSVYIIIPVHNRVKLTMACLAHLDQTGDYGHYSIIVIDDGSTDGTSEAIAESYPNVTILKGDGNLWWTGAIAMGMEHAHSKGAKYFVWLNDDCRPVKTAIAQMVEYAETNGNTIVTPAIYHENSALPVSTGFCGKNYINIQSEDIHIADGVSGYCVLIPRIVCDRIGYPDAKRFPHYAGDGTYTLRATRAGFQVTIVGYIKANILGPLDDNHMISNYSNSKQGIIQSLRSLFSNKKSPYYLPSRFFYYIEKYGVVFGFIFFASKLSVWTAKFIFHRAKYIMTPKVDRIL